MKTVGDLMTLAFALGRTSVEEVGQENSLYGAGSPLQPPEQQLDAMINQYGNQPIERPKTA